MKIGRRSFLAATGAATGAGLLGLPIVGRAQQNEVLIGSVLPLTGPIAPIGATNRQGIEYAVDEINAAGGIKLLNGAKLRIIDGDHEGKPERAISETERLIRQGVHVLFGAYQVASTVPSTQVAERFKVPYLVPVTAPDVVVERGFKYVFKISPKSSWYARDQVRFLQDIAKKTNRPVKKVALVHEATLYGQSVSGYQREYLKKAGIEIVADISYTTNAPDLTSEISRLKAAQPDAVLATSYIADAILITRTMAELQLDTDGLIGASAGHIDPAYIAGLGRRSEFSMTPGEWNPDLKKGSSTLSQAVNEGFKKKYRIDMNGHAAENYVAVYVLKDAIERAGSLDRQKLRDALAATNFAGERNILPYERIEFDLAGQNKHAQLVMLQVREQRFRTVWPSQFSTLEPAWPVPRWAQRKG
jgi:branched-chain amino acid transport system substrate-binding protein